ncbi:unnamed protein product [Lota lota]
MLRPRRRGGLHGDAIPSANIDVSLTHFSASTVSGAPMKKGGGNGAVPARKWKEYYGLPGRSSRRGEVHFPPRSQRARAWSGMRGVLVEDSRTKCGNEITAEREEEEEEEEESGAELFIAMIQPSTSRAVRHRPVGG